SVLRGLGGGGFGARTDVPVPADPRSVEVADVNGDAVADLVVASQAVTAIPSVLPGIGGGAVGPRIDYAAGIASRWALVLPLDADLDPDLVAVPDFPAVVSVASGDGAGGFGAPAWYGLVQFPLHIAVGDLNGDGREDLVLVGPAHPFAQVLLGAAAAHPLAAPLPPAANTLAFAVRPVPARDHVTFSITLPHELRIRLSILDAAGRRVRQLDRGVWTAGPHAVTWDGRNDRGTTLAAGVYVAELDLDRERAVRRVVWMPYKRQRA